MILFILCERYFSQREADEIIKLSPPYYERFYLDKYDPLIFEVGQVSVIEGSDIIIETLYDRSVQYPIRKGFATIFKKKKNFVKVHSVDSIYINVYSNLTASYEIDENETLILSNLYQDLIKPLNVHENVSLIYFTNVPNTTVRFTHANTANITLTINGTEVDESKLTNFTYFDVTTMFLRASGPRSSDFSISFNSQKKSTDLNTNTNTNTNKTEQRVIRGTTNLNKIPTIIDYDDLEPLPFTKDEIVLIVYFLIFSASIFIAVICSCCICRCFCYKKKKISRKL